MSKVESADLILKLYDLRREATMRKARDWMFSFNPTSADEYFQTMMDPDVGGYLRMVTSYWDMAAALVNHGAIDADIFNDTVGEHILVFAKIQPLLPELREKFQSPEAFAHLEKVILNAPNGAEKLAKTQEWMKSIQEEMAEKAVLIAMAAPIKAFFSTPMAFRWKGICTGIRKNKIHMIITLNSNSQMIWGVLSFIALGPGCILRSGS